MAPSTFRAASPEDIQNRVRRGYLDRLEQRIRKMRMMLAERDWQSLRIECAHLKNTASGFGFRELSKLAGEVESKIPTSDISRAVSLPEARASAELLFAAIDQELSLPRSSGAFEN